MKKIFGLFLLLLLSLTFFGCNDKKNVTTINGFTFSNDWNFYFELKETESIYNATQMRSIIVTGLDESFGFRVKHVYIYLNNGTTMFLFFNEDKTLFYTRITTYGFYIE